MVSKIILIVQNLVLYYLMLQWAWCASTKAHRAVTVEFKRLMHGLFALSITLICGITVANVALLVEPGLPTIPELLVFQLFVFGLLYVWNVLNPRTLDEGLEKP